MIRLLRKCPSCGVSKPPNGYYKDRTRANGLDFYCKSCSKAHRRASQAYKDRHNLWAKNNKIKVNAHDAVKRAIKNGKLVKPDSCDNCGEQAKLNAHHTDYTFALQVVWLCTDCHHKVHHPQQVLA